MDLLGDIGRRGGVLHVDERPHPRQPARRHDAADRIPILGRRVDAVVNGCGIGAPPHQVQGGGMLQQCVDESLGIFAIAQNPVDLDRRAGELLGLGMACLLDQDVGQVIEHLRRIRVELAVAVEATEQRTTDIGFGFGKSALSGLGAAFQRKRVIDSKLNFFRCRRLRPGS